ncbi:MAG: NADP-dependent phosphogluconate dehydrogenase [Enterobacteriaceae bacterium]
MKLGDLGIIGMSLMGTNLSLNFEDNGYCVSLFNRTYSKTEKFFKKNKNRNFIPCKSIKDLVLSLKKPRIIFIIIKSGKPVDEVIKNVVIYLSSEDIVIDCGNSFYLDSIRRYKELKSIKLKFAEIGISGGEKGARNGACIMFGGNKKIYKEIYPYLKSISASFNKERCLEIVGPNGSGHYLKMVHNGIEYGNMQSIADVYILLKQLLKLNNKQISDVFFNWNKGKLNSYLIEITSKIFLIKYKKSYLIDNILDIAEDNYSCRWFCKNSIDLCSTSNIIIESLISRFISISKNNRIYFSKLFKKNENYKKYDLNLINNIKKSLFFVNVITLLQGFEQLNKMYVKKKWNIDMVKISKIFRSGCIIKSNLINKISNIYKKNNKLKNLLFDKYIQKIVSKYEKDLRKVVLVSVKAGIYVPSFSSALSYFDSIRSKFLPLNLIQAQRYFFGKHKYVLYKK